jgi:uncharacterized protein (TIGR00661 family)
MKVIYAVCSWGLGHATRSLPVIRKLIKENNEVTIISEGRSLELLKKELGKDIKEFIEIPDYPMLLSENARQFMAKSVVYWPIFIHRMRKGLTTLTKLLKDRKCDRIISDARFDMYNRKIPSFFISHQMRIMNPLRIKMFEKGSETFNLYFFKRFRGVIIPDFEKDNLSGDLSHNLSRINENKLNYVGVLSDFKKKSIKKDIDYFLSISGPEPQRSIFEKKLLDQIDDLSGKVVVTLGKTEQLNKFKDKKLETYSFLTKEKREDFLNRSKLIISRSGYSTILDLSVINAKALMVPTPGQIEQEYLAKYHKKKKFFHCVNQDKIDLSKNVKIAEKRSGIKRKISVEKAVENIIDIVNNPSKKSPF